MLGELLMTTIAASARETGYRRGIMDVRTPMIRTRAKIHLGQGGREVQDAAVINVDT